MQRLRIDEKILNSEDFKDSIDNEMYIVSKKEIDCDICGKNDLTISFWSMYDTNTLYMRISDGNNYWQIDCNEDGEIRFSLSRDSGISKFSISTGQIDKESNTGFRSHFAFIKIANKYAFYLDGKQISFNQINQRVAKILGKIFLKNDINDIMISHSNLFNAFPDPELTDVIIVPSTKIAI